MIHTTSWSHNIANTTGLWSQWTGLIYSLLTFCAIKCRRASYNLAAYKQLPWFLQHSLKTIGWARYLFLTRQWCRNNGRKIRSLRDLCPIFLPFLPQDTESKRCSLFIVLDLKESKKVYSRMFWYIHCPRWNIKWITTISWWSWTRTTSSKVYPRG